MAVAWNLSCYLFVFETGFVFSLTCCAVLLRKCCAVQSLHNEGTWFSLLFYMKLSMFIQDSKGFPHKCAEVAFRDASCISSVIDNSGHFICSTPVSFQRCYIQSTTLQSTLALRNRSQRRPLADCFQRGPRATPTNLRKPILSIEAAYVVPAPGPHAVFFKRGMCCRRKPKWTARF